MSWNWLKGRKNIPSEKDIARECERIYRTEETSKKLYKEGRKLSEVTSVTGQTASKIGTDFNISGENGERCHCATVLRRIMDECDRLSHDKHQLIQKTLVDPMKRYTTTFPQLNAHIKAHEKAQQEYKKIQTKVDKMKEKEETGPNLVKMQNLKKDLAPVKEEFDMKHNMLLEEFPLFYNDRLEHLQPIFESLVMSQCWYHHELSSLFEDALKSLTDNNTEQDLESEVQDTLEQIKALSITKD